MDTCTDNSTHPVDMEAANGVKRIKLVMKRKELRELLSKKILPGEMLVKMQKYSGYEACFPTRWQPLLETIPEGSE
ncbi:hypothetical protein SLA2020_371150 [Shorea laevis]